jgi:hypothetical protein
MKSAIRLGTTLASMAFTSIVTMSWAFAQEEYETPPTILPTVERAPEVAPGAEVQGEVAFTGFRLTVWVALLVALVAIGAAAIWAGRRRSAAAKHAA